MEEIKQKRALTITEAAEYACVSRGTVENWLAKGILPFEELPSRGKEQYRFRRIRREDLDVFLNRHYQQTLEKEHNKSKINKKEIILLPRNY
jgi:excisionase family DNA binding protein